MMEDRLAYRVNELISDDGGKDKLFETLQQYKSSQDLEELLVNLRSILDEPSKLEIYEYMRPLILLHHQLEFSQRVPAMPGVKLRTVRLRRRPRESLGFAVRGGFEHGVGVFVTQLTSGSQADMQGLRLGDEIVRVNGFTISEAIHDDVLNLIKAKEDIVLRVTHVGMIPVKEQTSGPVVWKYADETNDFQQTDTSVSNRKAKDLKIFVDTTGYSSFGCGIISGTRNFPGIFVEKVKPGSLAEEVGLEVGDQIVQVNDTNVLDVTHQQAVLALKSSRQLTIIIRQQVGSNLFRGYASHSFSTSSRSNMSNMSSNDNKPNGNSATRQLHQSQIHWQNSSESVSSDSVYATVVKNPKPSHSSTNDRPARTSAAVESEPLDESAFIAQQLGNLPFGRRLWSNKSLDEQLDTPPPIPSALPAATATAASMTYGQDQSDSSSTEKGKKDEAEKEKTSPGRSSNLSMEIREELEERKKIQMSSPLSGAAAVAAQQKLQGSVKPDLLGRGENFNFQEDVPQSVYKMFTPLELDGRPLRAIKFKRTEDLGVSLEGGLGSPLNGKVIVSIIFEDGIAKVSGKMKVGDQLMAINGQKLIDVTVAKAQHMLENSSKDLGELIFCESTLVNEEDTVTYF